MVINKKVCILALIITAFFTNLSAIEISANLNGGGSVWTGNWTDKITAFSEDFSQQPVSFLFPAIYVSVDILFSPWNLFNIGFSLGGGNWGGRVISEGGSGAPRVSSIYFGALEGAVLAGKSFALQKGYIITLIKTGIGYMVSPLYISETWQQISSVQSIPADSINPIYLFAGLSASYGKPFGSFLISGTIFLDGAAGAITGRKDLDYFYRFGLGLRVSRDFSRSGGGYSR